MVRTLERYAPEPSGLQGRSGGNKMSEAGLISMQLAEVAESIAAAAALLIAMVIAWRLSR